MPLKGKPFILDRLFLLLDTGSTALIRKSAAEQLGDVQRLHPHEINTLLSKVHVYLQSSNWDTRIAAGQAVEAIARNVAQWEPRGAPKQECEDEGASSASQQLFSQFDVGKVLSQGESLLGSVGAEYDVEDKAAGSNDKDQLMHQRRLLNERLGLDMAASLGVDTSGIFNDEDLVTATSGQENGSNLQRPVGEILKVHLSKSGGMSARERNRAKRKAKLYAKQISRDLSSDTTADGEPSAKRSKSVSRSSNSPCPDDKVDADSSANADSTLGLEEPEDWPFDMFCEILLNDLFNSSWVTRHGATTGLREVIKHHGRGAGKSVETPANHLHMFNQMWLSDLSLRLLCVLALDRFGDYVSDEVVAPVRETCAQTLGIVIRYLDTVGVQGVVHALLQLLSQQQWEVRHGGLLGLKYLLAVRQDLTSELLPLVLPSVYGGLQDSDDDVRAVAASALVPVCDSLVKHLPQEVPKIMECLWETLLDLDDLTASTNSIMSLLSTLLSHPKATQLCRSPQSLTELVPRLWPFLRHNIASVRKASLDTLLALLFANNEQHPVIVWLPPILPDMLRHIYQRSILESNENVLNTVEKVWDALLAKSPLDYLVAASTPFLGIWVYLIMQPTRLPYDPNVLIEAKHRARDLASGKSRLAPETNTTKDQRAYIGGFESAQGGEAHREDAVIRARIMGARLLGQLCCYLLQPLPNIPAEVERPDEALQKLLLYHLGSKSALQRLAIAQIVYQCASRHPECVFQSALKDRLMECLNENIYYDEIALAFTRMQSECRDFISCLKQYGVNLDEDYPPGTILTLEQASNLTSKSIDQMPIANKLQVKESLESRRKLLQASVTQISQEQQTFSVRVLSTLAASVIYLDILPEKLNPVIRPLMDSIKREENTMLQNQSATSIAQIMLICTQRPVNPNPKVIKNLITFLCSDPTYTPAVDLESGNKATDSQTSEAACSSLSGILTLSNIQKTPERGRRWMKKVASITSDQSLDEDPTSDKSLVILRRGAEFALTTCAKLFAEKLPQDLPTLWDSLLSPLAEDTKPDGDSDSDEAIVQDQVNSLQVLESVSPSLHPDLLALVLERLPTLCKCLDHRYTAVRHMAARCFGAVSRLMPATVMAFVVESILPLLGASDSDRKRQGASEALANIIDHLSIDIVAYIVLLVVPVLGRMSDQDDSVRLMATHCFATLIRLMPLEAGIPDPPDMKQSLVQQREEDRQFLEQLLDGTKVESYKVSVPIKAELRKYQQDGINWLAFLNKYQLHGILCDDMGLGKTLQSICILASDQHIRQEKYKENENADCRPLPSIVICPPTLTGHWVYEVEKFISPEYLHPLHYTGAPGERARLQKRVKKHNLIVASYDIVRNDIDFFGKIKWNYCILDEGHIIKNGKTKISKAVKQLSCNHRLILSGTPIQNNVLDLWSLFDFLMPGFLGTEKQFLARYGKPILQSREAKSTSKEQEAGVLAMESLHRQVLPFILRRLKEDVLQDLPPKIIQDYYCDLSPLQSELYEDFAQSHARKSIGDNLTSTPGGKKPEESMHIFQALQYLRKVCNHPALVLTRQHPKYSEMMAKLKAQNQSLNDIQHSPKLIALRQLLQDCGIGVPPSSGLLPTDTPVVNQHRVLLFCQLKSMLDIVEKDLLKGQMPSVTYLRLDGSVPAGQRHGLVTRFNNDPSIDLLLLTTHVGGLGLNLTGADTVIFVEHDWNPMKDLQAMDRAHRIGQKKVVNVYRLITRGTLEEKIMGLQKFKMTIANTVISQENASLSTMGTDQILDLFNLEERKCIASKEKDLETSGKSDSMKSILSGLEELWDEKQYESEYNLDSFMDSLGGK